MPAGAGEGTVVVAGIVVAGIVVVALVVVVVAVVVVVVADAGSEENGVTVATVVGDCEPASDRAQPVRTTATTAAAPTPRPIRTRVRRTMLRTRRGWPGGA